SGDGVTLLPTGASSNRVAALTTGKVAGTLLTEPSATKAQQAGMKLLLDMTDKPFLGSGVTVSDSFAKANPNTIVAFIESLVDAMAGLQAPANKAEALKVIAKWPQPTFDTADVTRGYNNSPPPGQLQMDPPPDAPAGQAIIDGLKATDAKTYADLSLDSV